MTRKRDPDKGQYQPEHTDDDFLNAVDQLEATTDTGLPTTNDVAQLVGCHEETARRRLNHLANQDRIQKLEIGNSFAWRPIDT